jgi:hypothetical protein
MATSKSLTTARARSAPSCDYGGMHVTINYAAVKLTYFRSFVGRLCAKRFVQPFANGYSHCK